MTLRGLEVLGEAVVLSLVAVFETGEEGASAILAFVSAMWELVMGLEVFLLFFCMIGSL